MKIKLLLICAVFFSNITFGQNKSSWEEIKEYKVLQNKQLRKSTLPKEFRLFGFNYSNFIQDLQNVPNREDALARESSIIVSLPNPEGKLVQYRIVEAPTFEASLQSQFPQIRSFVGSAINDPGTIIRFSVSPSNGLSAITRTSSGDTHIIDPYSLDYKTLIVYDRNKSTKSFGGFVCTTDDAVQGFGRNIEGSNYTQARNANDGKLRKFQMAQSCTGEYANYFGATSAADVALVLAAYNATYTRVNAIFEMDFNCTMELIANTTDVIYYDPTSDPYSPATNLGNWNGELGVTLENVIGLDNYDIGHLFGASGGGGNAGCIGCVCSANNSKGTAYTSPADNIPEGDFFDVDYVAHEIGHQLGGNHTFSHGAENNFVNMEPGSGVTIMGYAGITGATDVADNSIPIFHAGTIDQVTNNIMTKDCVGPNSGYCLEIVNTGNAVPVVSAPATKTLPRGTAFKLIGSATDSDSNDVLSYAWEQIDDATTVGVAASYPSETKTNGANFRSYMPTNTGVRYFPRLQDHVANGITGNQWEIVPNNPASNRTLNFRLTVRDNRLGGGNNESTDTAVTFDRTKGPFLVTSQAVDGISYVQGSVQNVTWSVNGTNTMTGASNVNIKLSIDGGQTFPITLVSNTLNDGAQSVTIPNVSAPYCRILVEPTGNDFYAINSKDFAIGYTVTTVCNTYTATPNAALSGTGYVGYNLNIPDSFTISDFNVITNVTAGRTNNIRLGVVQPGSGVINSFLFLGGSCGNNISDLNVTFDDDGAAFNCASTTSGVYLPVDPLNQFNGMNSQGLWRLAARINSTTGGQSGTLNSFSFQLCYKEVVESPNPCGAITTTWDGTTWSNGSPLNNVVAIFNGNYSSTTDLEACSVIVNSGFNVVFNSNNSLIVGNGVTVNGTGVLTIENNAALVQIDKSATNTGNIVVKRDSSPMIRLDYTAWSSPVVGQQLKAFSPNTIDSRFYEYLYTGTSTPTAYQTVNNLTNFISGKGYIIRVDNNWSSVTPTVYHGQFTGVPFNGDLSTNLGIGYNLIGNPYPSPIDADRFLLDNASNIGAIYFWSHTVPASGGSYPVNNFSSYTKLGGAAAAAGGATPDGIIQTGQGFYVRSYDFGTANFSNYQRVNASASTQFFRLSNSENNKSRLWLNLFNDVNNFNQILIGYMDGATNEFDNLIDGKSLDTSNTMLYSLLNDEEFVIQGKGLPFSNEDIVPLGLKILTSGNYTISIDHFDGLFFDQDVFIKDKYENIEHNLKSSDYSFLSEVGVFDDRFEIIYRQTVLSLDTVSINNTITVTSGNNQLKVNSSNVQIESILIYDLLGRLLFGNNDVNELDYSVRNLKASNQLLIVDITLVNGVTDSKKIIY